MKKEEDIFQIYNQMNELLESIDIGTLNLDGSIQMNIGLF